MALSTTCLGRRGAGFTLLELLIVVVILGVLAAVVIPRVSVTAAEAKRNACQHNKAVINEAVERWHSEKGAWPMSNLNDIEADPTYFPDGLPVCPVNGQKYTLDPITHRVAGHDH